MQKNVLLKEEFHENRRISLGSALIIQMFSMRDFVFQAAGYLCALIPLSASTCQIILDSQGLF